MRVFESAILTVITLSTLWDRWMETPIKPITEVATSHPLFCDAAGLVVGEPLFSSVGGGNIIKHIRQ
jgi:hypothetical protein